MKTSNISQGSLEWLQARKGKIGGTDLKSIMGTPKARQEYVYEFIADLLTIGIPEEYENAMERGLRLEDEAVAAFEFETGKSASRMGYCQSDNHDSIMSSPDRLLSEKEALEIKCLGGKNHVKLWLTNTVPDDYIWQVVQYFVVNERLETLYFVGYNPDIPIHPLHIIELKRQDVEDKIKAAETAQIMFLTQIDAIMKDIIKI